MTSEVLTSVDPSGGSTSPPLAFNFVDAKNKLTASVTNALAERNIEPLKNDFNQIPGNDTERKTTLDQALRGVLGDRILEQKSSCEDYLSLTSLSIDAVTEGICSATTPFLLLGDVLDCLPLDQCEKIFSFVEENVSTWKSTSFYTGRIHLLRMCNDLLRRLSKSQNTVFCGRIQIFLARLFPLDEKSGLNLHGQFNLDNVTAFNRSEQVSSALGQNHRGGRRQDGTEARDEDGEDNDLPAPSSIPVDFNFYRKFWSLQDYFRNPLQCYDKFPWLTFLKHSGEILAVFDGHKLDDTQASRRKPEDPEGTSGERQRPVYFAKFLTSQKLMHLQLGDANFRRHVLLQYLILFQYLQGQVRFKGPGCVLGADQTTWIQDTTALVYRLLRETPPHGERFATMVRHILDTEENWSAWKNDGSPSFVKERAMSKERPTTAARKRPAPEDFLAEGPYDKIFAGNKSLSKLCSLDQDNVEACRSDVVESAQSLDAFFADAVEQADPANMVEDAYKHVRSSAFGWRALRLLSRRSPHFFQPAQQKFKSLAEYLDSVVSRLSQGSPREDLRDGSSEEVRTREEEEGDADNGDVIKIYNSHADGAKEEQSLGTEESEGCKPDVTASPIEGSAS